MTDRLTLSHAFEEAGIKSEAADKLANEIFNAIRENVATKTDLDQLGRDLRHELALAVRDLKIWTGSVAAALLVLLFTALRLWLPHG